MSRFVGASRVALADGLVALFDDVRDSGGSRWISLEAPSGWGKTRVGREFYARLAGGQSPPRYWPEVIADPNRKAVVPTGDRQSGSLPDFLWWGVSCSDRHGVAIEALRSDLGQLERHAPFVDLVCRRGRGLKEKAIQGALSTWKALAVPGAKHLAGTVVPGAGLASSIVRTAAGAARVRRQERRLVGQESPVDAGGGDLAAQAVEQLCALGSAGFPVVVFIEDVHLADAELLEVLEGLLRRGSHLLVVTTTWPGKLDEVPEFAGLARDLGERALRVGHLVAAGPPFPDGAGLVALDAADCAQIVRAHYPQADSATVGFLVDRYSNPLALELVCAMPRYREQFGQRGDLRISAEDIDSLPAATIEGLYRDYWSQLPERLRLRYAVAGAISPEAINFEGGRGHRTWSDAVLDEVIAGLKLPTSADLAGAVGATRDAYGWVAHVDEYLRRWAETDQYDIATDDGRRILNRYLSDARRKVLGAVASAVLRDPAPRSHSARTIVALHAEGYIVDPAPVSAAIAVVLGDLGYDSARASERRRLYELFGELRERDPGSVDADTDLAVRFNGIDAIATAGRPDLAAEQYRDLIAHTQDTLGPDHPDTLTSANNLALALRDAGRAPEAIDIYTRVIADQTRVLGPDHPDTLTSANNLALTLRDAGRAPEAIDIYTRVIADQTRVLGTDHAHTLTTRNNLALTLWGAGRILEAADLHEQVLADRTRVLGTDHPDTLTSANNLALTLWASGRVSEAIDIYTQVLADQTRILGTDHPQTLTTRNNLATALRDADRVPEAIDIYTQVLADQTRVLGTDHPQTLMTRNNLATTLRDAGRVT